MFELTVNGSAIQLDSPITVSELVAHLELAGQRIAIELNGDIVPRSLHASTPLAPGDRVEIVVAVGGG